MQIVKRTGEIVDYDFNRIFNAIKAARDSVALEVSDEKIREVADAVEEAIEHYERISIEEIQDIVEIKLMEFGLTEMARHYVLYTTRSWH